MQMNLCVSPEIVNMGIKQGIHMLTCETAEEKKYKTKNCQTTTTTTTKRQEDEQQTQNGEQTML